MGTITYNTGSSTLQYLYTTTGGGTVFSANLNNTTTFDYFSDTAVVNDAIYFSGLLNYGGGHTPSGILFNIGTPIAGTGITFALEYYKYENGSAVGWTEIPTANIRDNTAGLTNTGSLSMEFGLPWKPYMVAVNGVSVAWMRLRIKTLTTITEGGANSTATVKGYDGEVNVDGYTDGSPCTLADIYSYLTTNYSYLPISKIQDYHYNFTPVNFDLNSRLVVSSKGFEIGTGSEYPSTAYGGRSFIEYLTLGLPVTADGSGKSGGWLIIHGPNNSQPVVFGSTNYFYASKIWALGTNAQFCGYPGWLGTWYNCDIRNINFSMAGNANCVVKNCNFSGGGTNIATASFPKFENNMVNINTQMALCGQGGFDITIKGLKYSFDTAGASDSIVYWYNAGQDPTYHFINTSPALPSTTAAPRITEYGNFVGYNNPTEIMYYDASAGTYTDVTAAWSNNTAGDAYIDGDVGDCYYYRMPVDTQPTTFNIALRVMTSLTSNDYVYAFEYYNFGAWRQYIVKDLSNNFTVNTGLIFTQKTRHDVKADAITVNGKNYRWMRIRVVTKGTGNPAINRMYITAGNGFGNWRINDKYELSVKVTDRFGTALQDAMVGVSLSGTNVASGLTTASGQAYLPTNMVYHWNNGQTYPMESASSVENSITSAINTTSSGGIASNPINLKPSTTYTYRYTLTKNSGTTPLLQLSTNLAPSMSAGGTNWWSLVSQEGYYEGTFTTPSSFSTVSGTLDYYATFGHYTADTQMDFSVSNFEIFETTQVDAPLTSRYWFFDPIGSPTAYDYVGEVTNPAYDIKITKSGYEPFTAKVLMNKKQDLTFKLKEQLTTRRVSPALMEA